MSNTRFAFGIGERLAVPGFLKAQGTVKYRSEGIRDEAKSYVLSFIDDVGSYSEVVSTEAELRQANPAPQKPAKPADIEKRIQKRKR